jgi:Tfp pilus assembly protein PilO
MKFITFLVLIGISGAAVFFYVHPQYEHVKVLRAEADEYAVAVEKARAAEQTRDRLVARLNSFSKSELEKLDKIAPTDVDSIRLLLDINELAKKYNTSISGIKVQRETTPATSGIANRGAKEGYEALVITFNVSATYPTFIQFLKDMEKSLRIIDVTSIKFRPTEGAGAYEYEISFKTYYLKK